MASAGGDNIEKLYKNYEILSDAKDKISEHEKEYKEILDAIKGSDKEKRLASQFISKFIKFFPNLTTVAIEAQLDLCEDDDIQIRRQAIKDLPQLCKDTKEHTAKIGDILAQLLLVDDPVELQQVQMSLQTLAKYDAKGTLAGIFCQIQTGDEAIRDRCFKFLSSKFKNLGVDVITKDVEDFMIAEIKKIVQDVTDHEFETCMTILAGTKLGSSVTGHSELVALSVEQAELDDDIDPVNVEDEVVEKFIQCANHALPYFSSQVESTKFIKFMSEKFLPINTWNMLGATEQQDQMQLRLLKVFAEMSAYCGPLDKPAEKIEAIFTVLQEYMPLPPFDTEVIEENPSFQFSHAECLLYALHALGKQAPEFFTFSNEPKKLKEFRSRLQYLARGTQGYIKKLQESIKGKTQEELSSDENKIKVTALKTTSNISTLIRDLFHSPPSFKSVVHLSWINRKQTAQQERGSKRHAPITFGSKNGTGDKTDDAKRSKNGSEQRVYTPPSGKYSGKVQNYSNNSNRNRSNQSRRGGNQGKSRNFRRY